METTGNEARGHRELQLRAALEMLVMEIHPDLSVTNSMDIISKYINFYGICSMQVTSLLRRHHLAHVRCHKSN